MNNGLLGLPGGGSLGVPERMRLGPVYVRGSTVDWAVSSTAGTYQPVDALALPMTLDRWGRIVFEVSARCTQTGTPSQRFQLYERGRRLAPVLNLGGDSLSWYVVVGPDANELQIRFRASISAQPGTHTYEIWWTTTSTGMVTFRNRVLAARVFTR